MLSKSAQVGKKTTISVNKSTKEILDSFKIIDREPYDDVILRIIQNMIEDELEVNSQTKEILTNRLNNLNMGQVMSTSDLLQKIREKKEKQKND